MPLLVAIVVYGGTFFGYAGCDAAHERMKVANVTQQHFVELKKAAISKVAVETFHK